MSELSDFLDKHDACDNGRDWALATGCQTVAELWLRDDLRPDWRIWLAYHTLPNNLFRKFACRCVREVWHLLKDERSRNAVEVTERHADGLATDEDLTAAETAAWAAARAAARDAANDAAWAAAWAAAKVASSSASSSAARAASSSAARAAAWAAARAASSSASSSAAKASAWDATWDAARMRQNEILRELVPTLEEVQQ